MSIVDWAFYLGALGDARILSVGRTEKVLTLSLDCSSTAMHPEKYIRGLVFTGYQVTEDADIAGCFWYRAQLTPGREFSSLRVKLDDGRGRKRFFALRFRGAEYIS